MEQPCCELKCAAPRARRWLIQLGEARPSTPPLCPRERDRRRCSRQPQGPGGLWFIHIRVCPHHTFISFSDPFNLYCVCESGSEGPSIAVSESRDGTYIFALLPYILQRSLIAAGCDR